MMKKKNKDRNHPDSFEEVERKKFVENEINNN